jgi:hypothetical protein
MRDLYKRLGISPDASEADITAVIQACSSSDIAKDARAVLLDLNRKATFDRVHKSLTEIGNLRANLGLNHSDHWQSPEADDFNKVPSRTLSAFDVLTNKVDKLNKANGRAARFTKIRQMVGKTIATGFWVFVLCAFAFFYFTGQETKQQKQAVVDAFDEPMLPLPESGTIQLHKSGAPIAPLRIETQSGSNYLVKLEDAQTGENALDVFVRGGNAAEFEVPLGNYTVKYASGNEWYGYTHLFGPATSYTKADKPFRFYQNDQGVSGYTITLYRVADGNLRTSKLNPNQF